MSRSPWSLVLTLALAAPASASDPEDADPEGAYPRSPYPEDAAPGPGDAPGQHAEPPPMVHTLVSAEAHAFREGRALAADLAFEGEQWGLSVEVRTLERSLDGGGLGLEGLHLGSAMLTYAFISLEGFRVRLEGGASGVISPGLAAFGPAAGGSFALALFGPLGLEGSALLTLFPHGRLDWSCGAYLGIGQVVLRAGVRQLFLDDHGLTDGAGRQEAHSGPYAGLALVF